MSRPKADRHSTDLDAEIARLEQERKRLIQSEDQRRGAIIRDCLTGKSGDQIRALLHPLVGARDAFLFGLEPPDESAVAPADRPRRTPRRQASEPAAAQPTDLR